MLKHRVVALATWKGAIYILRGYDNKTPDPLMCFGYEPSNSFNCLIIIGGDMELEKKGLCYTSVDYAVRLGRAFIFRTKYCSSMINKHLLISSKFNIIKS